MKRLETATRNTRYPLTTDNDVGSTVRLPSKIPDRSYSQFQGQGSIRESSLTVKEKQKTFGKGKKGA